MRCSCVVFNELIVAGRLPVATEVDTKETRITPGGGAVLIAEVGMHVAVQGQLSIRLAAFGKSDPIRGASWDKVAEALVQRSVRLMAGELGESFANLLAATRKCMTVNVCGWYRLHPSASGASVFEVAGECAMLFGGPRGPPQGLRDLRWPGSLCNP